MSAFDGAGEDKHCAGILLSTGDLLRKASPRTPWWRSERRSCARASGGRGRLSHHRGKRLCAWTHAVQQCLGSCTPFLPVDLLVPSKKGEGQCHSEPTGAAMQGSIDRADHAEGNVSSCILMNGQLVGHPPRYQR